MRTKVTLLAVFVAGIIGVSFFFGFYAAQFRLAPYPLLSKAAQRLANEVETKVERSSRFVLESIFFDIEARRYKITSGSATLGGGLTSMGAEVLLLRFDGLVYRVTDGNVTRLPLAVPDNGFSAYQRAASSEKYKHLSHRPDRFRYNDILYYQHGSRRGLVISYTEWRDAEQCFGTALALLPLGADELGSLAGVTAEQWRVVYRSSPCLPLKETANALEGHMAGGRISFQAPATVLLANGDYHRDGYYGPGPMAQLDDNDYGKVIAVNIDSEPSRVVSKGHRNPQGIVHTKGKTWLVEHGARGGDELNLIHEGADYGWPSRTLGTDYDRQPWPGALPYGSHAGYTLPVFAWLPSLGVSNITTIDGFHDTWAGDLLVASMEARSLYRVRTSDDRVVFIEQVYVGERIRYAHFHQPDGQLYLWTDSHNILVLAVADSQNLNAIIDVVASERGLGGAQKSSLRNHLLECAQCHSLGTKVSVRAPSLQGIVNAGLASTDYPAYSAALRDAGGVWDVGRLSAFLRKPQALVPGVQMPDPNIRDQVVLESLVEVLSRLETD